MKWINKKFVYVTALVVAASLLAVIAVVANVAGSDFEIDDGNLLVDGGGDAIDWAAVVEVREDDEPSGQDDDSFGQGTKEDTEPPDPILGSIPPNKSDLKTFGVYQEENESGKFLHLFWTRVQDPQGTTNMDFEFNQSTEPSSNLVTPVRTAGDLLIVYELSKGGTVPNLFLFTWLDGTQGIACEASNTYPCWGDRTDLSLAGAADGSINEVFIPAADSDGLGDLDPRTFGEATIDLDFIFDQNACTSFGSAYLKSRSSDSFTAALKDYIAPTPVNITNCGSVIIRKQTNPDGATDMFGFNTTLITDPASNYSFDLADDDVKTFNNVLAGTNLTITEDDPASLGFALTAIDCSASDSGVSYTPNIVTRTVTFDLVVGETLDCTFTNSKLPQLRLIKAVVPAADPGAFDLSDSAEGLKVDDGGNGADSGFFTTTTGSHTVSEAAGTNTDLSLYDSKVVCDSGKGSADPGTSHTFSLDYGDVVTCTFTNTKKGKLIIDKVTNPSGSSDMFGFDLNNTGGDPEFSLADATTPYESVYISAGSSQTVTEVNIPAGWYLTNISCDDGGSATPSTVDVNSATATINIDAGETVTCTFTNETGAILVTKTAKDASQGSGLHPLPGVTFSLNNGDSGVTDVNGQVCFDGLEPGEEYTVTETIPTGYALAAGTLNPQNITVTAGATCTSGTPDPVSFVNDPLAKIVITFYSLAGDGVMVATNVSCTGPSYVSGEAGPLDHGDEAEFTDLREGTYTCTIVVDP